MTDVYQFFKQHDQSHLIWKTPKVATAVVCQDRILRPQENSYQSDSNRVMRIQLPREDISAENAYLCVSVMVGATGATRKALANYSTSMFEEARIRIGTFEHSIRDYNICQNFFLEVETPHDVKERQLFDNFGWAPDFYRDIQYAGKQNVIVPLKWIGFDKGVLPLDAIYDLAGPQDQWIELVLAEPTTCVETDGINPTITIDSVEFHYEKISSKDDMFKRALVNSIRSGGGYFSFPTIVKHQNPIVGSISDLQIQFKGNNITDITHVLTDISKRNDVSVRGKFQNYPKDFGGGCVVRYYQMEVGGAWYPMERVDCSDQAQQSYMDYLRNFGFASNVMDTRIGAPVSLLEFNGVTNSGLFFMNFNLSPLNTDHSSGIRHEDVVNPFNLRAETRSIIFKLDMTNPPPPGINLTAYHLIRYNQVVRITPGGSLEKVWQ